MRTPSQRLVFAERRKKIQVILWDKLETTVNKLKPGGPSNTNAGNTARKAFEISENLAECENCKLLKLFKTTLIAIVIHLPGDPLKFQEHYDSAAAKYVSLYS